MSKKRLNLTVDVVRISEKTRYEQAYIHHRMTTSHAGSFATDLARAMTMCAYPQPPIKDKSGHWFQAMQMLTPKEIAVRATEITKEIFAAIETEGWATDVPAFADLITKDSEQAGFRS